MIAEFIPSSESAGTILQRAHGHVLTVNLSDRSRVVLIVSDEDAQKVRQRSTRSTKPIEVTDLMTGQSHQLVGDACGLGCRCAIRFA